VKSEGRKYPHIYRDINRKYVIFVPKAYINNSTRALLDAYEGISLLSYLDSDDHTPDYIISIKKACIKMLKKADDTTNSTVGELIDNLNKDTLGFFKYQHRFKKPSISTEKRFYSTLIRRQISDQQTPATDSK
jgi:uncharacterized membrane protein (UPF0182 family)